MQLYRMPGTVDSAQPNNSEDSNLTVMGKLHVIMACSLFFFYHHAARDKSSKATDEVKSRQNSSHR